MNDMVGATGMLRGWAMLWQMEFVWLLPGLVVSVALVTLLELLVSLRGPRVLLTNPRSVGAVATSLIIADSVFGSRDLIIAEDNQRRTTVLASMTSGPDLTSQP